MGRKEKTEKAPALYDLTALQRDANRILGYTAQQTLDYLQSLYEKKLCTYPRTDSRFLTEDMEDSISDLVSSAAAVCGVASPATIHAKQVCNNKKVTDHHAIVPTVSAGKTDLMSLPLGEREVLKLAAKGLLRAITYALLSRCGMEPGEYFEHEDFLNVFDFNTPQTVAALGTAAIPKLTKKADATK